MRGRPGRGAVAESQARRPDEAHQPVGTRRQNLASVVGVALTLIVLAVLVVSSALLAACSRLKLPLALLLAYLVAWVQLTLWPLALSPMDALTQIGIVIAACLSLGLALLLWLVREKPVPTVRPYAQQALGCLRDPVVGIPALAVGAVYVYLAAAGLLLPQNDSDPLVYQLTRSALWRQQQSVGIVGDGVELRLDGNPIVAELGGVVWLTVANGEKFVWLSQFGAVFAMALAVGVLARRIGMERRESMLSAVLVPTLAVVVVQAVTAYNDVLLASFLVSAAAFALCRGAGAWLGLMLAVALAVATKFTGPLLICVVAVLVMVAHPPRRWHVPGSALVLGAFLGSGWYVVNLVRTGDVSGGIARAGDQTPDLAPAATVVRVQRLTLDAFDLSGSLGHWRFGYAVAAIALALCGLYAVRRKSQLPSRAVLVAAAGLVLLPDMLATTRDGLRFAFGRLWAIIGDEAAAALATSSTAVSRTADGSDSWFGPLFVPLVTAVLVVTVLGVLRHELPPVALGLAATPILATLILALTIIYDPWRGRFLIAPAAMSVAVWGVVTRKEWVAWLVSVGATVTLVSCAATWQGKPSGLGYSPFREVGANDTGSIWGRSRWEVQTQLRRFTPDEREERDTIRFVEQAIPADATVALRLRWNDFRFPIFGVNLRRAVSLVGPAERVSVDANWLIVAPGLAIPPHCARSWVLRHATGTGWRVLQRVGEDDLCQAPQGSSAEG